MTTESRQNPLSRLVEPGASDTSLLFPAIAPVLARDVGIATNAQTDRESVASSATATTDEEINGGVRESAARKAANVSRAGILEKLTPAIQEAKQFAEQWPEIYQPEIFRTALA